MNPVDYAAWLDSLVAWAVAEPAVIGVVAVGSTAATDHPPDEFSDHDLFVVTRQGAAAGLRADLGWLPDAARIVMVHVETEHGRGVVYDDGHLVELAVFDDGEVELARLNAYRILVDRAGLGPRLAAIAERTAVAAATSDPDERFQTFVQQLIIGLNRGARGETLSANQRIRGDATTALVGLLAEVLPTDQRSVLDNLDPHRRFERVHPALGRDLAAALEAPLPVVAANLVAIAEHHLAGRVTAATPAVFAAVRSVIAATGGVPLAR